MIERDDGNRTQFICVECVEGGRPATVEWVERMWGKHFHLPTNQLVLVSESGFTGNAVRKAEAIQGVEILSLDEAQEYEWPKLITDGIRVDQFLAPVISKVNVIFAEEVGEPLANLVDVLAQSVVVDPSGVDTGSVIDFIVRRLHAPEAVAQIHKAAFEGVSVLESEIPLRPGCRLRIPSGQFFDIVRIDFEARCERKVERVDMKQATYGSTPVAHGTFDGFGGAMHLLASSDKEGLKIALSKPKPKPKPKKAK